MPGNPFGKKSAPRQAYGAPAGKPRMTVGSLFNPNIGASLRPFGQTGKMLVNLIASIFAANGLFPRNHPALLGIGDARLTLSEVIGTGWRNLRFTQATLPQTLIFFAVIASLGCSVLAILAMLMALMTGTAHAQNVPTGASMFQAPNPSTDIALGWMNWLFFGTPMQTDYLNQLGQQMPAGGPSGSESGVQLALTTALAFYSDAILVVAAILLFYHLTSMIVETAHHGVAMGRRANQVWAPIRLVVAIGLLVPISSGLNSGQYILLQVAAWGSGLASNAWGIFLNELANDNFKFVPPGAPYAREAVVHSYLTAACQQAYNQIISVGGSVPTTTQIPNAGAQINMPDGTTKYSYSPEQGVVNGGQGTVAVQAADNDLCGNYITPAQPQASNSTADAGIASAAYNAVISAFQNMQTNAINNGETDVENFIDKRYGGQWPGDIPTTPNTDIENMAAAYVADLQNQMNGISTNPGTSLNNVAATSISQGWVGAGSWFNTIMRLQGEMQDIPRDLQPKTAPPQVRQIVSEYHMPRSSAEFETAVTMTRFQEWLQLGFNSGITGQAPQVSGGTANQQGLLAAEAAAGEEGAVNKDHFMDEIFKAIDWIASWNNVWKTGSDSCNTPSCFTLGVQFTSFNPIAEIAQFGHANIDTAYDLFDDYIVLQGGASVGRDLGTLFSSTAGNGAIGMLLRAFGAAGQMSGEAAASIGTVVGAVVVVFFTSGFLLAYFLPLIPFYRFLFGVLSWFFSLFEAVVAVPLIALAHLTPEGEGFMGDKAKGAYYFVFDIFLRPILMVFGLIVGFLIFDLAASAMNLLYVTAVAGAGGLSYGHMALSRLVYSILYVVILYLCCNNCFKMIDWLPEHAIKWMGGQSLHHQQMGDPMEVGGYMGLAGGYIDNQIVQGTGKLMGGPAGAVALGGLAQSSKYGPIVTSAEQGMVGHFPAGAQGAASTYFGAVNAGTKTAYSAASAVGRGAEAVGDGIKAADTHAGITPPAAPSTGGTGAGGTGGTGGTPPSQ